MIIIVNVIGDYPGKLSAVPGMDFMSFAQVNDAKETSGTGLAYEPLKHIDLPLWDDVLENCTRGVESVPFQPPSSSQADTVGIIPKQEDEILGQLLTNSFGKRQEFGSHLQVQEELQVQCDFRCAIQNVSIICIIQIKWQFVKSQFFQLFSRMAENCYSLLYTIHE